VAQKTVFSEGRTLCARVARPYSCHGISSADMGGRVAVGLMETRLGQAQVFLSGRAEPAPPRGTVQARMALRGQTRGRRERRFSRRDALCASVWQGWT
jgi:hypothetical protein